MNTKHTAEIDALKRRIIALEKENEELRGKALTKAKKDNPDPFDGYEGKYKHIPTGEVYALKIVKPEEVRGGKTHFVKNATHSGDYTPTEFRALFDKL